MKKLPGTLFFLLMLTSLSLAQDWANLARYQNANAKLEVREPGKPRVVFMGNSITQGWPDARPEFFSSHPFVNRGISGQTTPQMLIRFRQDVLDLDPTVVVILAGTNDLAGNTGPMTLDQVAGNIKSMAELAVSNGINVILCSVLPVEEYFWNPGQKPLERIPKLNALLRSYAEEKGMSYVDYYSALVNADGGLARLYSEDGVHPIAEGYLVMEQLVLEAIESLLH